MRLWDFLFLALVILPVITGGIYIRNESLRFELTQPGLPLLIFCLLALWKKDLWKNSKCIAFLRRLYDFWKQSLAIKPTLTLFWATLFITIPWWGAALSKHWGFNTHAVDVGIFSNALWNLAFHGSPTISLKAGNHLLLDHQNYWIYPLALLYRIIPAPEFLLFLQSAWLASGGIALAILGKQWGLRKLWPLLPLVYWAYSPVRAANIYEFHPETIMLPLFLFGVAGIQAQSAKHKALGAILFLSALAAKESAGPVAVGIGLILLLGVSPKPSPFTRSFGALAILLGAGIFYFNTKVLPGMMGGTYGYADVYAPLGSSLSQLALSPFTQPTEFFGRIFAPSRLKFILFMMAGLAFLPIFRPLALLAAAPGFLMLFLTNGDQRVSTGFHYGIEPAVGLLLALPAALSTKWALSKEKSLALVMIFFAVFHFGRSEILHWRLYKITDHQKWLRDEMLPYVNPKASVSTLSVLLPHLTHRRWVEHLPSVTVAKDTIADCVVWDTSVSLSPMGASETSELEGKLLKLGYLKEAQWNSTLLYRLPYFPEPCWGKISSP